MRFRRPSGNAPGREGSDCHLVGRSAKDGGQLLLNFLTRQPLKVDLADADDKAIEPRLDIIGRNAQRPGGRSDRIVELAQDQRELVFQSRICGGKLRSEEHTSELQSLMRISYAVFCLKKKTR